MRFKIFEETPDKSEVIQVEKDIGLKFRPLSDDAGMMVVACDMRRISFGRSNIITFNRDGTIFRCPSVDDTIGFQLDELGRIKDFGSVIAEKFKETVEYKDERMKVICGCGRDAEFIEIDTSHSAYVCKECKGGAFVYSMSDFEARELFEEMLGMELGPNETKSH